MLKLWDWIVVGSFNVPIALQLDQLSAVMLLVVTGVGLLIFIYSKGYMHGDPGYYRFYAYLCLFAFSMLMLVLGGNYLLLYFGWEAVGLCSYYLIGFYYHKQSAAAAGKKAFLTNRVGDFGFGLGIMLIFTTVGTLNYTGVFEKVEAGGIGQGTLTAIALLLFMGAMGKSAQFPLHVWLPDAMEGPTPVSALIHAATMVTAGVYMVARSNVIFASAPDAMLVVGGHRGLHGPLRGHHRHRAERHQTGAGLLHRLPAGLHVHGPGGGRLGGGHLPPGDARLLQGPALPGVRLRDPRPVRRAGHAHDGRRWRRGSPTRTGYLHGRRPWLWRASSRSPASGPRTRSWACNFAGGKYVIWAVGIVAAFITAFYTFRMIFMTFWNESRMDPEVEHHVHESPWVMIGAAHHPGLLLAGAGFALGIPVDGGPIHTYLEPVFAPGNAILGLEHEGATATTYILMLVSLAVAMAGIALAYVFYVPRRKELPQRAGAAVPVLYRAVLQQVVHRRDL